MNDKLIRSFLVLSLITSVMVIAGCGAKSYEKQHYLLDAQRAPSAIASDNQNIVEVRRFTVETAFSTKGLTYRKG